MNFDFLLSLTQM